MAGSGEGSEEGHVEQRRAPESWAARLKGTILWGLVAVLWGVVGGVAVWFVSELLGLPLIGSSPTLMP
ncbi:hypothetical protein [Cellulosimicrobium sp. NPDC057862]|uniref:hypothetical protein n=1 Tax=Cellulosimicrobium sp. NPDC057862 TaxID=3346266 RepID=UPI00366C5C4B